MSRDGKENGSAAKKWWREMERVIGGEQVSLVSIWLVLELRRDGERERVISREQDSLVGIGLVLEGMEKGKGCFRKHTLKHWKGRQMVTHRVDPLRKRKR